MSSDDNLHKQFGPRSGLINVGPDLDPNCLTLWWYSWKNFLKKFILKKSADDKQHAKLHSRQRVNMHARLHSESKGLKLGRSLHQCPIFTFAISEGPSKTSLLPYANSSKTPWTGLYIERICIIYVHNGVYVFWMLGLDCTLGFIYFTEFCLGKRSLSRLSIPNCKPQHSGQDLHVFLSINWYCTQMTRSTYVNTRDNEGLRWAH